MLPANIVVPQFILTNPEYLRTAIFSHGQHNAVGQTREATGEPYIVHPIEVATIAHAMAHEFGYPAEWIDVAVQAALLHDTIEDTDCNYNQIEKEFGAVVRDTVFWLTDVVSKKKGNRRVRKELEKTRLTAAPGRVKFIKCCDIIANARTVLKDKPDSAQLFLTEKMALLDTFVYYNRMFKGTKNHGKLDKQMLAKCRSVLVDLMDTISKP